MEIKFSKRNNHKNNAVLCDMVACSLVEIFRRLKVKRYFYIHDNSVILKMEAARTSDTIINLYC
jgi:hypothetical protein